MHHFGRIIQRIGGDEFTLLTNSEDIGYAESLSEKIRAFNGQPICFDGQEIPLNLHVGIVKLEDNSL